MHRVRSGAHFSISRHPGLVFLAPMAKFRHDRTQGLAIFGERIFHLGRDFVKYFSGHDSVTLQFAQLLRQHFLGGIGYAAAQFAKSHGSGQQLKGDDRFPFPADDIQGIADWAFFKSHGFQAVSTAQISAYLLKLLYAIEWGT